MAEQPGALTMKIKVLMTDKAMQRPVMDDRERMLSAAVSPGTEISVDCIRKGPDELDCHTDPLRRRNLSKWPSRRKKTAMTPL